MNPERRKPESRVRETLREPQRHCLADIADLRQLLAMLRPLGQATTLALHAAHCHRCFARLADLFLATAPAESDPLLRIIDGVNASIYRLAKALLHESDPDVARTFCFDKHPDSIDSVATVALDSLDALDDYSEGRTETSCEAKAIKQLVTEARSKSKRNSGLVETLLRRSIAIGGRHALDAANLLGFLRFAKGDLDGAELLFNTVCRRATQDGYERECQAHAMNNLAGVHVRRGEIQNAILWCERSLMLKERLGLDARSNYLNLIVFWLDHSTLYGQERVRHYLRNLLALDAGKAYVEQNLKSDAYRATLERFKQAGLDKDFPELALDSSAPPKPRRARQRPA
jgi:hypothetical protein